ncbi:peroxisomal membrane protein [Penicillium chrysogenum]|uniref:Peroxisomal membrane protein n=1 Tax=Penicillium chrysogenum TaxID=5076 RepID=A0ABQ8WGX4_PENCH|nr:peroxisomal membrane protein [Penicillium chrysogenum]KAJ5250317.1 peroxisomal membrane protein [Penicillium chrysogenum]KAJ5269222.1 peroxisomal membrane protein [Penicillium chrysogenum]
MAPSPNAQDHGQSDSQPPTVAAFSPSTITGSALTSRQRSSVIVHRKSPLLVATPPAITRALAYSHPFLLPLNKLAGLLTWTSGDPWQSFLLVATFWTIVLYSDAIILWAGPILVVVALILGMYGRRYSPLSSTTSTGEKHRTKVAPDSSLRHQKSLDEIVETLRIFTTRCNILLEPLLDLTDFLSTQRTPTSATTKPALTALFIRILLVTPVWIGLTLPPFYILTTRRIVMAVGTIVLTYHSRPARVSRVILWRSRAVRRLCAAATGLSVADTLSSPQKAPAQAQGEKQGLNISTRRRGNNAGVRFTFVVYENQRRWLGIGWTYSLFPAERDPWTDEHMNPVNPKDSFELPEVQTGDAKWRWVEGSEWRIEGADNFNGKSDSKGSTGEGWIYYDNKWNDGRRGQDGWDRYTRRRKWYRDAELADVSPQGAQDASEGTVSGLTQALEKEKQQENDDNADAQSITPSTSSKSHRRRWFSGTKDKEQTFSGPPADSGRATGSNASIVSDRADASRPISIKNSRKSSHAREGSVATSDSASLREKEIANSQDHLDRWSTRAAGGTERAEREFGLSDEVNMGLS